jgi:hypothetical protein
LFTIDIKIFKILRKSLEFDIETCYNAIYKVAIKKHITGKLHIKSRNQSAFTPQPDFLIAICETKIAGQSSVNII